MSDILILLFLLTLSVFFILVNFYKKYCIDAYRQEIFRIRDDLFNFAAAGGISFSHPAYGMVRTYLNGTIRFTEHLSLIKLVTAHATLKDHTSTFEENMENRLKGLNVLERTAISRALNETTDQTILFLIRKNVFILSLIKIAVFIDLFKSLVNDKLITQYKQTYSDAIYEEGSIRSA